MLKTFEESSTRAQIEAFLKRSGALAIDLLNKYRGDPFFRTEVNVIALQVAFALVILGLVGTSFSLLYHDVSAAIVAGIRASLATDAPSVLGPTIVQEIQAIRAQNLVIIVSVIVITTMLFGYIIARITLSPARSALNSQKQFIGNIAHELRTPLSVIKTNTEVALLDRGVTADLKSMLLSNIEEMDRISEIINNLLSLSSLVQPERMEFRAIDLSVLADEVIKKYAELARRGDIKITLRRSQHSHVWGNLTALQQIIGNLLKNGISYTPRGGFVEITTSPALNNRIELTVRDSGIGIARKDLFRIFEPFYRADPSRVRGLGGSGLGLTIVSELVKLHHGKISVRSAAGRGTTVSVLLPAIPKKARVGGSELREESSEIAEDFSTRT